MGLGDLVKKEERKAKVKYGNQSELTEHKPEEDEKEKHPQDQYREQPAYQRDRPDVEYGDIEKPCPHCGCISTGDNPRTFDCPNPECSVTHFTMSWNEFRSSKNFLGHVEIDGWRHNE